MTYVRLYFPTALLFRPGKNPTDNPRKLVRIQSQFRRGGAAKLVHPVSRRRRLIASLPVCPVRLRAKNKIDIPCGKVTRQMEHTRIGLRELSFRVKELGGARVGDAAALVPRR